MDNLGFELPQEGPPQPEEPTLPTLPPASQSSSSKAVIIWTITALLFLIVVGRNAFETYNDIRRGEAEDPNTVVKSIEYETKTSYGVILNAKSLSDKQKLQRNIILKVRSQAKGLAKYTVLRRLAVLENEFKDPDLAKTLAEIQVHQQYLDTAVKAPQKPPKASSRGSSLSQEPTLKDLQEEQEFNRLILTLYTSKNLQSQQASDMITKVKKSQLGWFGRFTTIHINEKAGRIAETNRLRKYLDKNAKISFGILLVFMLLVFLGGLAGFALLIGYIVYRKVNKSTNLVIPPYADQPITVADSFAGAFNIYFWLYSFSGIYLSFLFGGLFKRIANTGSIEKTLFVLLAYDVIIVGLAVIWLTKFAGGKGISLRAIGWRTDNFWEDVAWGFGGYLATIPFLILAVIIAAFFDNVLPSKANPIGEIAEMTSTFSGRLLVLAMASVFAPLVEETFFRGVLFPAIWRRTRRLWLAIFASALFFAFVHPQFLSGALAITIIGSFLALLYAERRSLIPGAVMHAIHNTVLMILIFLLYSR